MFHRISTILKVLGRGVDLMLIKDAFLSGYSQQIGSLLLQEIQECGLVSLSWPEDASKNIASTIRNAWQLEMPQPGKFTGPSTNGVSLVWMAPNQIFILINLAQSSQLNFVRNVLGNEYYLTDQSDNWCGLRVMGPEVISALERICPIDLHQSEFPPGSAARTVMEHLGMIILCVDNNNYVLFSANSYAQSFLHAIQQSALNVT